jgi:antitoxin (DNA-binding transcriptional repressor) of toxin-antitoxin stability system
MQIITESEAQESFDSLLDRVAQGESFLIKRGNRVAARMTAARPSTGGKMPHEVNELIGQEESQKDDSSVQSWQMKRGQQQLAQIGPR